MAKKMVNACSLQCRGPEGDLKLDVGVLIKLYDDGTKDIYCPFYKSAEKSDSGCTIENPMSPKRCVF